MPGARGEVIRGSAPGFAAQSSINFSKNDDGADTSSTPGAKAILVMQ